MKWKFSDTAVETVGIKGKFEKIDFYDWILNSRNIDWEIATEGLQLLSNELKAKGIRYKGKTYSFETSSDWDTPYIRVALLIEEDRLISGYQIYVAPEYFNKFLKEYHDICNRKLECVCEDDIYNAIICFLNDVFENGEAVKVCDMNQNLWHFDHTTIDLIDSRELKELCKNFSSGDIVKLSNNETGKTYYGYLCKKDNKVEDHTYLKFYSIDYDETEKDAICFKFFYAPSKKYEKNIKIEKIDESELNKKQKIIIEKYKNVKIER